MPCLCHVGFDGQPGANGGLLLGNGGDGGNAAIQSEAFPLDGGDDGNAGLIGRGGNGGNAVDNGTPGIGGLGGLLFGRNGKNGVQA